MISNSINHLGIDNYRPKNNQVWNKLTDLHATKENRKPPLLIKRNPVQLKQNNQRIFINFFIQAVANFVKNIK